MLSEIEKRRRARICSLKWHRAHDPMLRRELAARTAAWRKAKPETALESLRQYHKTHPTAARRFRLKRYGLTPRKYKELYKKQGGVCAICQRSTHQVGRLQVDHCHTQNIIRGLLCRTCNVALGDLQDNCKWLLRAIQYVKRRS